MPLTLGGLRDPRDPGSGQWHTVTDQVRDQLAGPAPKNRKTRHERLIAAMNNIAAFLPLLVVLAAFMFFASRRQKRAMQATIDLHDALRVGDRVHTTSGMEATITAITDDNVDLEIAPGVVTTWMKLAIRDRIEPETPEIETFPDTADEAAVPPEGAEALGAADRLPRD